MKVKLEMFLVLAALTAFFLAFSGPATSSPSPTPTPTPTPFPSPSLTPSTAPIVLPTAEQMAWAKAWHKRAVRERAKLARVRACFRSRLPVKVSGLPGRGASAETWVRTGKRCRYQARDWHAKTVAGIARLRHPGGSGAARWWPAARYCGWPEHLENWFCYVVWRESSARAHAVNPSSGCYGLLQLHPCHWGSKGRAWISDPLNQLRLGWKLYREAGASPWAL